MPLPYFRPSVPPSLSPSLGPSLVRSTVALRCPQRRQPTWGLFVMIHRDDRPGPRPGGAAITATFTVRTTELLPPPSVAVGRSVARGIRKIKLNFNSKCLNGFGRGRLGFAVGMWTDMLTNLQTLRHMIEKELGRPSLWETREMGRDTLFVALTGKSAHTGPNCRQLSRASWPRSRGPMKPPPSPLLPHHPCHEAERDEDEKRPHRHTIR